ncbi:MAG: metallophosphoesterase [Bacteroidales bacterium]|nr:metallophosphoesterase [Bacteroidales bacterium]MCF8403437.1 metallophosphoesterase [Bacteroidales bacterium]
MRKVLFVIFSIVLLGFIYFFLWSFYPKNLGIFPGFVILYILDVYLYSVYNNNIWRGSKIKAWIISFLFWLPFLMLICMSVISVFYPFDDWGNSFKAYYGGIIFSGYVAKLIPLILILLSDLIKIFRRLTGLNRKNTNGEKFRLSRGKFIKNVGIVTGGLFFGTLSMGMFKWIYDFRVRKNQVVLPKLPAVFRGFRIVQISDIHLGSWLSEKELKEAVQIINDLNPDIVFFTGDLVNYTTDEAYPFEDILKRIHSKFGVYSTLGNHDYGDYKRWNDEGLKQKNLEDMYSLHERLGWKLLRNQNEVLNINGEEIAIIGVENWGSMKRFQKIGDIDKAIIGIENVPVKLLLSHDPSHWQYKVSRHHTHIDLTFSGHTHGAQFGIEIPGVRWSPSQYIYKYWAGLYSAVNKNTGSVQYLYVNRGIGSIGYPGRVGILPEITLIELTS